MAVLRKVDIKNDEIMVNLTKIIIKVVACVDFSAPIIQEFEYFEHRFYLRN
jgi:hypothetical protein